MNDTTTTGTEITGTKADKGGNFYFWFSPRGFANEGHVYSTSAEHVDTAVLIGQRACEINGGCIRWMKAKDAIKAGKPSPSSITNHPWFFDINQ